MAIAQYENDGVKLWRVYIDLRSKKNPRVRVQKRINGLKTEKEAIAEDKKLFRELTEKLIKEESKGITWEEVIDRWVRQQELYPTRKLSKSTIMDYEASLRNYTTPWLKKSAQELNRADGREILIKAEELGRSARFRRGLKYTINMIYTWGIEERFICGVQQSPVAGIDIDPDREEKKPDILTILEIRELLKKAKEQKHDWYPVWVGAILTGCRSGELHQLKKSDLEIVTREQAFIEDQKPFDKRRYGFLRVRRSWNTRLKETGPTKSGYWRTVPVSSEFYWFLIHDLKIEYKTSDEFLFNRAWEWDKGEQARLLRAFCIANNLPSIKFHALRACFATQLITAGIPATIVMKICGWRDLKTMQRYIRLAGVDESGATEVLRFIPTEEAVMEKVVSLYDYKS